MNTTFLFRIICIFYLAGWWLCVISFFRDKKGFHRAGEFVLSSSLLVHLLYTGISFSQPEFSPFYTVAGILQVLSVLIMIIYLYLDYSYGKEIFELIFPPLTVFFLMLSNLLIHQTLVNLQFISDSTFMSKAMLFVHAFCSMLGYSLFGGACLASIFFLFQEKKIKTKKLHLTDANLPSLGFLDRLNYRMVSSGFLFLTIGLLMGVSMRLIVSGKYEGVTPRQLIPLMTWLFYALILFDRSVRGLRGKTTAIWAILGFSAALISFVYEMHVLIS